MWLENTRPVSIFLIATNQTILKKNFTTYIHAVHHIILSKPISLNGTICCIISILFFIAPVVEDILERVVKVIASCIRQSIWRHIAEWPWIPPLEGILTTQLCQISWFLSFQKEQRQGSSFSPSCVIWQLSMCTLSIVRPQKQIQVTTVKYRILSVQDSHTMLLFFFP